MPILSFPKSTLLKFNKANTWIENTLVQQLPSQTACLQANSLHRIPSIDVSPNEGKHHYLLAKMISAKRVLEIGTLGGYSAIWFARAVGQGGKVVSLEMEERHAEVARENIKNAGFEKTVDVRVGKALETLGSMRGEVEREGKFDMVFIDADKENNVGYLEFALEFSRVGAVIVLDNVVRYGQVLDVVEGDAQSQGVRDAFEWLKNEKRVECTAIQTVGPKEWDGFAVILVVE